MVLDSFPPAVRDALSPVLGSPRLTDVVFLVGLFAITSSAISVAASAGTTLYNMFLRRGKRLSTYGKWAVVTGATDGIGKSYAEQLAKQGCSVVLISRTQAKLDEVAKQIADKYKVETKTIAVDFSNWSPEAAAALKPQLDALEVGVLVNNVGVSYDYPEYFDKLPEAKIWNMHRLNIDSVAVMTHIVLPQMLARKKGVVINIASTSGQFPMGLLSMYSASKAYVDFLTRALAQEYGPKGIIFQSVLPSMVASKLSKVRPSLMVPTPQQYVSSALRTVGNDGKTFGYWSHSLQNAVLEALPSSWATGYLFDMHAGIRKRALRKMEKVKAAGEGKADKKEQ
ncbi:putative estradiol 17-beta-dehydrogenase [Hyaloraphidium curvatum]|nr:putative estradiol 17-beta-dehydrogenase [Hyaloraphidium curvatum]